MNNACSNLYSSMYIWYVFMTHSKILQRYFVLNCILLIGSKMAFEKEAYWLTTDQHLTLTFPNHNLHFDRKHRLVTIWP